MQSAALVTTTNYPSVAAADPTLNTKLARSAAALTMLRLVGSVSKRVVPNAASPLMRQGGGPNYPMLPVESPPYPDLTAGPDTYDLSACPNGMARVITPESFFADVDQDEVSVRTITGAANVPGWAAADVDFCSAVRLDYPIIGPKEALRACISRLASGGAFQATPIPTTTGATTLTFTLPVGKFPMLLGFAIDIGMPNLSFNPFDFSIATTGFVAVDTYLDPTPQVVDRFIVLRANKPGGRLFLPFAARPSGVTLPMPQDAVANNADASAGTVVITAPAAIITAGLQASLLPLAAFTDVLAQYGSGLDVY